MNRFARSRLRLPTASRRHGFTLIEVLVATLLSLMLLGAVIQLFATVSTSITQSRAVLESADRLRATQNQLQRDLEGLTVTPMPPRRSEFNEGYLEIFKGPVVQTQTGPRVLPSPNQLPLVTTDGSNRLDTTIGALGNILMFTTRSKDKPFVGRYLVPNPSLGPNASNSIMVESDVAEVAYFLRGGNLHRRVLLVAPSLNLYAQPDKTQPCVQNGSLGFYADNDISVRWNSATGTVVANTLGDLTHRECRFGHPLVSANQYYDISRWHYLGLPTLQECSDISLVAGKWDSNFFTNVVDQKLTNHWNALWAQHPDIQSLPNPYVVDFWSSEPIMNFTDSELTAAGTRTADDLILTNVISFDVKVWDPGYPILQDASGQVLKPGDAGYILPGNTNPSYTGNENYIVLGFGGYVDLGYCPTYDPTGWKHPLPCPPPVSNFCHLGFGPLAAANIAERRIYDTWCNSYDNALSQIGNLPSRANDGFDNGTGIAGIVDNDGERAFVTPYPAPLRGIQVIIRIFEPDSRQIREVTIEQDFLPK